MYKKLRERVFEANLLLVKYALVTLTWGNVSEIDRERGIVAIKPSGVAYSSLKAEDIVIVSLEGEILDGKLRPSSDTPTHLELYRRFPDIGGITHCHSRWATSWAQSGRAIPPYGTTHADCFYGQVPCTPPLSDEQIGGDYELNTGRAICDAFERENIDPMSVPSALVCGHGPFSWGKNAEKSVENAVVLEETAMMAAQTEALGGSGITPISKALLDKHYLRKHGDGAYYGQK